jgi:hypothetical protein
MALKRCTGEHRSMTARTRCPVCFSSRNSSSSPYGKKEASRFERGTSTRRPVPCSRVRRSMESWWRRKRAAALGFLAPASSASAIASTTPCRWHAQWNMHRDSVFCRGFVHAISKEQNRQRNTEGPPKAASSPALAIQRTERWLHSTQQRSSPPAAEPTNPASSPQAPPHPQVP